MGSGCFQELIGRGGEFAKLIDEYGALETDAAEEDPDVKGQDEKGKDGAEKKETKGTRGTLMSEEERNRGAVPATVYSKFLKHAGGVLWAPLIIFILALMQAASGPSQAQSIYG